MDAKPKRLPLKVDNIPEALKALPRWVLWRYEYRAGKWAKPPRQANDSYAASNNPETWVSFPEAVEAYAGGKFDGIGIVLPDGIIGIDLDDCLQPDSQLTELGKMVTAMLPTYCEVSPSGKGLKLIAAGQLDKTLATISKSKGVELYAGGDTNRYFTITGNHYGSPEPKPITGQSVSLAAIQSIISGPHKSEILETFSDIDRAGKALEFLAHISTDRAEAYDSWLAVGMALNWCDTSAAMLEAWQTWSSNSPKYDPKVCENKWESFTREAGRVLTLSYLQKLALADGYDPTRYQTGAINAIDLLEKNITRDYFIHDFMVANEPMILGGASKTLKTSIALEMALSLATGTKLLNRFPVKAPQPVLFLSGESGEATLQESLKTMVAAKGIYPKALGNLFLSFKLPKISNEKTVDELIAELRSREIQIVFLDPLYRSLKAGADASNIYSMGEQLEWIAEKIQRAGITIVLLHHFRKQGKTYGEPPELEDLSQSGIAEFGRQFLLLKRCERYQHDGKHNLWFTWGGSAGHQGESMLEVYTGTRKTGLTWQTTIRTVQEWEATKQDQKTVEKSTQADELKARILVVMGANPGISTTEIIKQTGGKRAKVLEVLEALEMSLEAHFEPGPRRLKKWFLNLI